MKLNELFVSYKQVDPIKSPQVEMMEPTPIYVNLERAQRAASTESTAEQPEVPETIDMSNWRVQNAIVEAPSVSDTTSTTQATSSTTSTTQAASSDTSTSSSSTQSGTNTVSPRWNSIYAGKRSQWIADMTAAYRRAGLSDNAIKNLMAKNALESGWGNTAQGDYNFGNITSGKYWKGRVVKGRDHNAAGKRISQTFRAYDSLDDYVKDEIQFLTRLYDFDQNDSIDVFINKLQGGNKGGRRYAEARDYASKVRSVYNSI